MITSCQLPEFVWPGRYLTLSGQAKSPVFLLSYTCGLGCAKAMILCQRYVTYFYNVVIQYNLAGSLNPSQKYESSQPIIPSYGCKKHKKNNNKRPEIPRQWHDVSERPRSPRRQATKNGAATPAATELTINTAWAEQKLVLEDHQHFCHEVTMLKISSVMMGDGLKNGLKHQ